MLSREALQTAIPLADALDANNTILTAVPNTPLAMLLRATRADAKFVIQDANGQFYPDVESIEYIANVKNGTLGYSDHDITMDEITAVGIEAVQNHIAFAKNVAMPAVIELADNVKAVMNTAKKASELLGMEVVVWNPPQPLLNKSLDASLREFDAVVYASPEMCLKLPVYSFPELLKMMETGKGSVDDDIAVWAGQQGETFFLNLWNWVFRSEPYYQGATAPAFHQFVGNSDEGVNNALAIYLWARRLIEEEPAEGLNISLDRYRNALVDFRDQAGMRLYSALQEFDRDIKAERMIRSISGTCVVVHGELYKAWLDAGGDNEVLFGNMLSSNPATKTIDLTETADALRQTWHRHEASVLLAESSQRYTRVIATLRQEFMKQLGSVSNPEETTEANVATVMALFEEELARVTATEIDDIYGLTLRLVCRSRFYKTQSERILAAIERIKTDCPNVPVREAAAMATKEYIAYWLSTQLKPVVVA